LTEVTWPQFKHAHAGMENEEISKLWKKFKEGKYLMSQTPKESKSSNEVPREEDEIEELTKIQEPIEVEPPKETEETEESEEESEEEEAEIEQIETPQSEEKPPETPEPTPEPPKPTSKPNNDKLAERLRDSMIFGL